MSYTIDELKAIGFEPRRLYSKKPELPDYMGRCIDGCTVIFKRLSETDRYALHFPGWDHSDEIDELIIEDDIPIDQYIGGIVSLLKSEN